MKRTGLKIFAYVVLVALAVLLVISMAELVTHSGPAQETASVQTPPATHPHGRTTHQP